MTRSIHPEAEPDEVRIGNMFKCDFRNVGWTTKRLGRVAYDTLTGEKLSGGFRPVFVRRAEIEAAGIPIPDVGPIDHMW